MSANFTNYHILFWIALFLFFGVYALAKGSLNASRTIHKNLSQRLMHFPISFFDVTPIGRIVNRFSKDIDTVDEEIPFLFK